ncbi:MAG: hypothetical protein A2176_15290 [Spirochaetes bacterium RBG_13_51_14]|nr:MAG: hypothetical protein A2176_15290 [Spirochaetes bacterium RBG_13_51_14]
MTISDTRIDRKACRFMLTVIFMVVAVSCGTRAFSQVPVASLNGRTSLHGEWKIQPNDDDKYAAVDYDDSSWDSIRLPGTMFSYIFRKSGSIENILWLRQTLHIDRALPREDIGLMLGRIGNADETYFNGVRIGGMGTFPPDGFSVWNHPRYYVIPKALVRYGGKNVIAVRIWGYIFCEMLGTLAVTGMEDWNRSRTRDNFFLITLNYIIIAMGVPIFFIFFFFYIRRRSSQEYLFYCLQLACGLIIVLELCIFWNIYGSQLNRLKILAFAWAAINVTHPIFLHRIYGFNRRKTEILLWFSLASISTLEIFFAPVRLIRPLGIMLILGLIGIGFYNLSCQIYALYKKSPYSKLFSFFGSVVVIGAIHDGFMYLFKFIGINVSYGFIFRYMIFPYSALVLYLGTTLVLVSRIISMVDEIRDLNTSLEDFVIENALLSDKLKESDMNKKTSAIYLTTSAEEKLKKVMEYIHKNYTSDISREGLAASVDVHPDNLGKLFKTYTNRKLGDYICELRVNDAARMLVETDETVINIAFSVGFESLRTFNRIFPKYMGSPPEKYRKQFKKIY